MRPVAVSFFSLCALVVVGCPVTTVCNTGRVMDDAGVCVCPAGTSPDATGACVGGDGGLDGGPADSGVNDAGPCGHACTGTTSACDATSGTCVECVTSPDCASATGHVCDTTSHRCVGCAASTDCATAAAPSCDLATHACVSCTTSADCGHLAGTTVCDTTGFLGVCVECTATQDTACSGNVCDAAMHACTTIPRHSTGLCGACVADVQCMTGELCIPMTFGSGMTPIGNFCLQRQDVTGACTAPYFGVLDTPSIDGITTTTCGLRATTCPALGDYTVRLCGDYPDGGIPDGSVSADGGVPADDRCGAPGVTDGRCVEVPADHSLRCTIPCLGPDDCDPGATCLATSPRVCSL